MFYTYRAVQERITALTRVTIIYGPKEVALHKITNTSDRIIKSLITLALTQSETLKALSTFGSTMRSRRLGADKVRKLDF